MGINFILFVQVRINMVSLNALSLDYLFSFSRLDCVAFMIVQILLGLIYGR